MSSLKKHLPLILMAVLLLLLIPMSSASDIDDNAGDVVGIQDSSDPMAIDESDINAIESSSSEDTLSAGYDYETTVSPSTVNYTKGESKIVTVDTKVVKDQYFDYDQSLSSKDYFVYIGGETSNPVKVNFTVWTYRHFTFDLSSISDKLNAGENKLYFHHSYDENEFVYFELTHKANPLTVNVLDDPTYVSTPSPANVYFYNIGDSKEITVNISYSDLFEERLPEEASMFVYINGEEIANRVKIEGVAGNATSFVFDLKTIKEKLVEGTNNLTFHPHTATLEGIQVGPYVFNQLKVQAQNAPEPTYDYVSTPSPNSTDYVKGESLNISVTADYDELEIDSENMYVYVNGDSEGIEIENVRSDSKNFTFDLANISDNLTDGENVIVFHCPTDLLDEATFNGGNYKFNPLTVNVKKAEEQKTTYEVNITDPAIGKLNYVKGNGSVKIFVATNYDYRTMKVLDNSKMYAFINGNETGIIVKNSFTGDDVRGSALTFAFYLTQFDEYLTKEVNTIIFHPDESYYDAANISDAKYQALKVIIGGEETSEIKYNSTPTVDGSNSTDYLIGDHKDVLVTVDCDLLDEFESYDKLFAWVGETSYQINKMANEGTVTVDLNDFINANYFEEGKTYTIYFHPDVEDLNLIGIKEGEYVFNPLTVTITGTYTPEPVVVYNSTPEVDGKSSIDYTIGNDTIVTVTVVYNNVTSPAGFDGKKMKVFINGTDGISIDDVKANATSFTINLADYIESEGEYNISFHPDVSALSWAFYGVDGAVYEFNNLTVNAVKASESQPEYLYISTPSVDIVDYVKGESCNVTFTLKYPDGFNFDNVDICVFIDRLNSGNLVLDVDSYDKIVTFDLVDIDDDLTVGAHNIFVTHSFDMFETNWDELTPADCQFNPLTVYVKAPEQLEESTYVSTPVPNATDYILGDSLNITVNIDYSDLFAERLPEEAGMFVYINGEEIANRVRIKGVAGNATSFIFDLKTISTKLVNGTNNLTFHPHPGSLEGIQVGPYTFNVLTVKATEPIPEPAEDNVTYVTTPEPATVDYTLGESSSIDVAVEYNETYSEAFGKVPMNVVINNDKSIAIAGIAGNVTVFTFDLKSISDYLTVGKNTVTFEIKDADVKNLQTTFNALTVNVKETTNPNATYQSIPTPSVVDYTLNESSIITVTIVYSDLFAERLPDEAGMFVYINGEEIANRVRIKGVAGNATSFTFDLKNISDRLVNGTNNLTFHPHPGALEGIQVGPYIFNTLTVNVGAAPEPVEPVEPVYYAGVIYVAVNGSDDNNGSENSPVSTIAKAIELASADNNTEHKIIIREGTYNESDLNITSALDISGEGNVIIDADKANRILNINTADAVNVKGITFKNGKASKGAAIYVKNAKITVDDSTFIGNDASSAAAILIDTDAAVITNSVFTDNYGRNGVVKVGEYNWDTRKSSGSNTIIENCTFNNHTGVIYGNSMSVDIEEGTDSVKVIGCNFTNNIGQFGSEHGAVYIKGDNAVVDGCLFENNTMGMAAAIQIDGENVVVKNSRFVNNTVKQGIWTRSGAIEVQNAAIITNNTFISNGGDSCSQGGAIDIVYATRGGDIFISKNRFINNTATTGAAIFVDGGLEDNCAFDSLTIEENIFEGNEANHGAGIYTATSETDIEILNNEFKNNRAINNTNILVESTIVYLEGNTMEDGIIALVGYSDITGDLTLTFTAPSQAVVGHAVNITASLTDDEGNPVTGPSVTFTVNGNEIESRDLANGVATIEFTPDKLGQYLVGGKTELDASVKTTTINSVINATFEIDDVDGFVGENITIPIEVNVDGKPVEKGKVKITINNNSIEADIVNGIANARITLPSEPGVYNMTVSYEGAEMVKPITVTKFFEKSVSLITIDAVEGNYTILGRLTDLDGNPISNANVSYVIDGNRAKTKTDSNGKFVIDAKGNVKVDLSFTGNGDNLPSNTSITLIDIVPHRLASQFNVTEGISIKSYAVDSKAGEVGKTTSFKLTDSNGNPIVNATVKFAYKTVILNRTTDENGIVFIGINTQLAQEALCAMSYGGDENYNSTFVAFSFDIQKKPITITASAKTYKKTAKTKKYTVTLKTQKCNSNNGKVYLSAGKKVTMKINGKTYTAKTNAKGQATFKIKINKKGKFSATVKFAGDKTYSSASKSVKITIK